MDDNELTGYATHLRSHGLDARVGSVYTVNGTQPGLHIGVDDFYPAWELNIPENRASLSDLDLVAIKDRRPNNFEYVDPPFWGKSGKAAAASMTEEQIGSITIGAACAWHHDGSSTSHSDESAIEHRVDGIGAGLTAALRPTQGHGKWTFEVFADSKRISVREESYDSKEKALDGLKMWLLAKGK